MQESYKRSFLEKGRGIHSRVYSIEGKNSKREYIVKIYEEAKFQYLKMKLIFSIIYTIFIQIKEKITMVLLCIEI